METSERKTSKRRGWRLVLLLTLNVGLVGLLLTRISWDDLAEVFTGIRYPYVVMAVGLLLLSSAVRVARHGLFFSAAGRWLPLFGVYSYLSFMNYVLPLKAGEALAMGLMKSRNLIPTVRAFVPVWILQRIGDVCGLLVCFTAFLVYGLSVSSDTLSGSYRVFVALAAVAGALIAALVVVLVSASFRRGAGTTASGLVGAIVDAFAHHASLKQLGTMFALSCVLWFSLLSMFAAAMVALSTPLDLTAIYVVAAIGATLNLIPLRGPLGIGTTDAAWAIALSLCGLTVPEAVAFALGIRVVQMVAIAVTGLAGSCVLLGSRSPEGGFGDEPSEHDESKKPRRIKVLYVAGWGHSGSTLLDRILGSAGRVVSVGEIVFFNYYKDRIPHEKIVSKSVDFECTCGASFQDCEFWTSVLARCDNRQSDKSDALTIIRDRSVLDRFVWILRLVRMRLFKGADEKYSALAGNDHVLFQAIQEHLGSEDIVICDSSKDFGRLVRLMMNPHLDVVPIHLVRDGRAVAYSYTKKKRYELGFKKTTYFSSLINWIAVNALTRLVCRIRGTETVHISYDLFCQRPEAYIRFFNRHLQLNLPEVDYISHVNDTTYHNVGGNLGRFKELQEIRTDTQWKANVSGVKFWIGTILVGGFNWLWVRRDSVSKRRDDKPSRSLISESPMSTPASK